MAEQLILRFYSVQTISFQLKVFNYLTSPGVAAETLYHPHLRQDIFLKDEFHYLSTPVIGRSEVIDGFDCSFECLSSPLCYSYNLAASRAADRKLWCELLSFDKYSHHGNYSGNQSSHHFVAKVIMNENLLLHTIFFVPFMSKSQNRPIQIFTVHTSDASLLNLLYFELKWIIYQEYQDTKLKCAKSAYASA